MDKNKFKINATFRYENGTSIYKIYKFKSDRSFIDYDGGSWFVDNCTESLFKFIDDEPSDEKACCAEPDYKAEYQRLISENQKQGTLINALIYYIDNNSL